MRAVRGRPLGDPGTRADREALPCLRRRHGTRATRARQGPSEEASAQAAYGRRAARRPGPAPGLHVLSGGWDCVSDAPAAESGRPDLNRRILSAPNRALYQTELRPGENESSHCSFRESIQPCKRARKAVSFTRTLRTPCAERQFRDFSWLLFDLRWSRIASGATTSSTAQNSLRASTFWSAWN
jgi:hypothetical protein